MAVNPIPPGMHSVTPHLVVRGAGDAMAFYAKAFGAKEIMRMPGPDGATVMHGEIQIGDSIVFLADEFPGMATSSPAALKGTSFSMHLYVPDVDAAFQNAVAAGVTVVMPPMNMFWGDRYCMVTDPFGHCWTLATHVEDVPPEEMGQRAAEAMKEGCK